jgi:hypothetical protein
MQMANHFFYPKAVGNPRLCIDWVFATRHDTACPFLLTISIFNEQTRTFDEQESKR